MSKMYIRVIKDGFIYEYNEILAQNDECEVIAEEVAYPERFANPVQVEKAVTNSRKRKYNVTDNLATENVPEEPTYSNKEVNLDASKDLP
jgi:hypothetical protein